MQSLTKRLIAAAGLTGFSGIFLLWRLLVININSGDYLKYDMSAPREVTVVSSYGEIYDRNGKKLVNRSERYIAVIDPETAHRDELEATSPTGKNTRAALTGMPCFCAEWTLPH